MCMVRLELATNPIPISIVAVKGFYKSHYLFLSDALPTELHAHFSRHFFFTYAQYNLILCCLVSLVVDCKGLEPLTDRL